MLHYGIEFWRHSEKHGKAMDAYMYEALRTLFDMPKATPHRAPSSEYALPPTMIQWEHIRQTLGERRGRHDPPKGIPWRRMKEEGESETTLPWKIRSAKEPGRPKGGETKDWDEIRGIQGDEMAIFTDGSIKNGKVGFSIVAYKEESLKKGESTWERVGEMKDKNILDAETWAIIRALQIMKGEKKKVKVFTDSQGAREWILGPRKEEALAYMWDELCEAMGPGRHLEILWIKGHRGNKGNERADALAKKGGAVCDPWEGTSHAARAHKISEARNENWKKWFGEKVHYYKRRLRRKLKYLRGLTRAVTIAIFRLRSDKGWGRTAIGKDEDREWCKCGEEMGTDHVGFWRPP